MKKNINVKNYDESLNLSYVLLALFFIFYQILSSILIFLPPFYGIFFCYAFYLLEQSERTLQKLDFRWYFCLAFLLFADITHNFFIFSSWIAFFIFYYACADWIKTNFKIGKLIASVFVLCSYGFIFILDMVFSYMSNQNVHFFGVENLISICIEALIAYVFFKDKI